MAFPSTTTEFALLDSRDQSGIFVLPSTIQNQGRIFTLKDYAGTFTNSSIDVYTTGINASGVNTTDFFEDRSFIVSMSNNYDVRQLLTASTSTWYTIGGNYLTGLTTEFGSIDRIQGSQVSTLSFYTSDVLTSTLQTEILEGQAFETSSIRINTLIGPEFSTSLSTLVSWSTLLESLSLESLSTLFLRTNEVQINDLSTIFLSTNEAVVSSLYTDRYAQSTLVFPSFPTHFLTDYNVYAIPSFFDAYIDSISSTQLSTQTVQTLATSFGSTRSGFWTVSSVSSIQYQSLRGNVPSLTALRYASPRFRTDILQVDSLSTVRFVSASRLLTGLEIIDPQFQEVSSIRFSTNSFLPLSASVERFSSFQGQISDLITGYFFTNRLELIELSSFTMAPNRAVVSSFQTNLVSTVNLSSRIASIGEISAENLVGRNVDAVFVEANQIDGAAIRASDLEPMTVSTGRLSTSLVQVEILNADYMAASTFRVSSVVADFFYTISLIQRTFSTQSFSTNRLETRELDLDSLVAWNASTQRTSFSTTVSEFFFTRLFRWPTLSTLEFTGIRIDSSDFEFQTMSTINLSSGRATFDTMGTDTYTTLRTNLSLFSTNEISTNTFTVVSQADITEVSTLLTLSTRQLFVDTLSTVRNAVQLGVINLLSTERTIASNAFIQEVADINISSFRILATDLETDLLSSAVLSTGVLSVPFVPMDRLFTRTNDIPFLSTGTIYNRFATFLEAQALVETSTIGLSSPFLLSQDSYIDRLSSARLFASTFAPQGLFFPILRYPEFYADNLGSVRLNTIRFLPSSIVGLNVSSVRGIVSDLSANILAVRQGLFILNYPETVLSTTNFAPARWTASNSFVSSLSSLRFHAPPFHTESLTATQLLGLTSQISSVDLGIAAIQTAQIGSVRASSIETTCLSTGDMIVESTPFLSSLTVNTLALSTINGQPYVEYDPKLQFISSLLSTGTLETSSIQFLNIQPSKPPLYLLGGQANSGSGLVHSYDGFTWSAVPGSQLFLNGALAAVFNGKVWLVAGNDSTNCMYYSLDGFSWTGLGALFPAIGTTVCRTVEWNGQLFVAGSENPPYLLISKDGLSWEQPTIQSPNPVYRVAWDGRMWVAAGGSGLTRALFWYSYTGLEWRTGTSISLASSYVQALATNGKLWVAGMIQASPALRVSMASSTDGIRWTSLSNAVFGSNTAASITDIRWNGTMFVAVSGFVNNNISAYSYDGLTWRTVRDVIRNSALNGVNWDGTKWYAGGTNLIGTNVVGPRLQVSYDGITWINQTSSISTLLTNVLFIASNSNAVVAYQDQNLAIPATNIPFFPVSTNLIYTDNSTLTFNKTLTIDRQWNTVRMVGTYNSSILSNATLYDLEVAGSVKLSTLALGSFDSVSTFGPAVSNLRLALSDGDAYKRTGANWLITSDKRLKTNIVDAQLDLCYETVKQLPLRRFGYTSSFLNAAKPYDHHMLGFVAQEVSSILPKAITFQQGYGVSNLQTLNVDQIQMAQIGALQKVIFDTESIQSTAYSVLTSSDWITARLSTMEAYVASLGNNV